MDDVQRIVELALDEDIGLGDITSQATVPPERQARGIFLAKSDGVVSGLRVAEAVFRQVDPGVDFTPSVRDGERISRGQTLATVAGTARSLLAAERVALNFLQRLSGVATATARFVAAVEGT
ncbi:MAG TPA: nicotinate-nucleotide diphosphorylase (carboxylating), partial [Nitrolancea sp.]|nr:nicotinate-nucleotide diphosphorylase (carboxylating) [Nitrolancea sp.]